MLTERQVLEIVPVGLTTRYRMEKAGRFPRSTYISPNRGVWFEDEIMAWQSHGGIRSAPRAGPQTLTPSAPSVRRR
jgi:predicted DNA-binding transcriptional regulator AlpA